MLSLLMYIRDVCGVEMWTGIYSLFLLAFSEAKFCLREKRIAFVGDSRIRQLFYSFIKMMNPEVKEVGNKVCCCYSFQ